jgi:hypothetical protein
VPKDNKNNMNASFGEFSARIDKSDKDDDNSNFFKEVEAKHEAP